MYASNEVSVAFDKSIYVAHWTFTQKDPVLCFGLQYLANNTSIVSEALPHPCVAQSSVGHPIPLSSSKTKTSSESLIVWHMV